MVTALAPKPLFVPSAPTGPTPRVPLRLVPTPPPEAPTPMPATRFGGAFGGVAFSISMLWTGKAAYDAVKAVPSQLPWMPGPSVAPEIWTDPKRVIEEAHARFGHLDTPHLNQLLFVREKQAVPVRRDAIHDPYDRNLMVPDDDGKWVQVPLEGQETGALVIGDIWENEFPRKPLHERASDEHRLIEIELGVRSYQVIEPKTDADKSWFEQYADYIQELAEAMRKRANGENVPLPVFVFNAEKESQMPPQAKPQIMNSAAGAESTPSSESSSTSNPSDQTAADPIDFRSDTVTRPSAGMRDAIAAARVGDDSYGEDPTVKRLERQTADLLGTEDALFFPTCTMANQTAVRILTKRGDEAVSVKDSHIMKNEADSVAAISDIHISPLGNDGLFTPADLVAHLAQQGESPFPTLMILENTHTAAGGRIFPLDQFMTVVDAAREQGLRIHLDGARLFNAAVATGEPVSAWGKSVDTTSICFSKGLGAPAGAALCGASELIEAARKVRKILGGSMRQAGILAAGALYALDHNINRLQEDHNNAKQFALKLEEMGIKVLRSPETNTVLFTIPAAQEFVALAKTYGVLLRATNDTTIRALLHLDISSAQLQDAVGRIRNAYQHFQANQRIGR